jgi:hypothetical protein
MTANLWKPRRERKSAIYIEHEGKTQSISAWAKEKGPCYETLLSRYHRGLRGAELFAPIRRGDKRDRRDQQTRAQLRELKQLAESKQAVPTDKEARRQAAEEKAKTLRDRRQQLLAELAAECGRPLIDAELLKPAEHRAIAERVRFSGQRNWSLKGLG